MFVCICVCVRERVKGRDGERERSERQIKAKRTSYNIFQRNTYPSNFTSMHAELLHCKGTWIRNPNEWIEKRSVVELLVLMCNIFLKVSPDLTRW